MDHFPYLFAAYSIIFAVIFFYVVFIWRRQARLQEEVHAMEERIKSLKAAPPPSSAPASANPPSGR